MKPTFTMLNENELLAVHEATLSVLEKTGVHVDSPEVAGQLKKQGARVVDNHVRFPREMIAEALAGAAKTVLLAARDPSRDLLLPKRGMTLNSTGGYSPFFYPEPGAPRRESTADDLAAVARMCDRLDEVDFFWPICVPTEETAPELEELSSLNTAFRNITKHVQCSCATTGGADWMIRLAEAAAGGSEALRKRPLFSAVASPTTPLAFERSTSGAIMRLAKAGVPVVPMNVPLAGTTAPSTFAGALVITNAEQLATLAIIRAFNPEAPMIYAADTGSADMRTGDVAYTNPDYDLFSAACADLARYYELPNCVSHGSSESREFATTAGFERNVLKTVLSQLTKTDLSCWMGSRDNCLSTSLWDIVLDAEVVHYAKQYCREPQVNAETLALSVIDEVGPRGEFISHEHTLEHFRDEICLETFDSGFLFRSGGDPVEKAWERARTILTDNSAPIIGGDLAGELDSLMAAAREEFVG